MTKLVHRATTALTTLRDWASGAPGQANAAEEPQYGQTGTSNQKDHHDRRETIRRTTPVEQNLFDTGQYHLDSETEPGAQEPPDGNPLENQDDIFGPDNPGGSCALAGCVNLMWLQRPNTYAEIPLLHHH